MGTHNVVRVLESLVLVQLRRYV